MLANLCAHKSLFDFFPTRSNALHSCEVPNEILSFHLMQRRVLNFFPLGLK
jgi:hypothetical protein